MSGCKWNHDSPVGSVLGVGHQVRHVVRVEARLQRHHVLLLHVQPAVRAARHKTGSSMRRVLMITKYISEQGKVGTGISKIQGIKLLYTLPAVTAEK